MLKFAYEYKSEIQKIYPRLILDKKYKYLFADNWSSLEYVTKDTDWEELHYVSVAGSNILGCIKFATDRTNNTISSVTLFSMFINNIKFYHDILDAIDIVFYNKGFRRIDFTVVSPSYNEKLYDKFIAKHGGRKIGYRTAEYYMDGKYYNKAIYEIVKENYKRGSQC